MIFRAFLIAVLVTLAAPANAGEPATKADLDTVREQGVVEAVNGITSSGQPDEAALKVFSDSGYAAVIDLRGAGEDRGFDEQQVAEQLGLEYVSLPITEREAINFENATKLDQLLMQYDEPVLIHCGSGNRVGALLALRASLNGADDEAALATGREAGLTSLEAVVSERLAGD